MTNDRRTSDRWERVLTKYGAGTTIALFLVWWMSSGISADMKAIRSDLTNHVTETNFYLHAICVNSSATPQQLAGCEPPR